MLLGQDFFARGTLEVARELVGCRLLAVDAAGVRTGGRIVEVEAYLGESDPASHAGRGPTPRSRIMFGPPGRAYVYLSYGVHHCLNLVTEPTGTAGAVLIRALEPGPGRDVMARRRGRGLRVSDRELTGGPGRVCRALAIDLDWNGLPTAAGSRSPAAAPGRLRVAPGAAPGGGVQATPRIGISVALERPFRFVDPASDCLSR